MGGWVSLWCYTPILQHGAHVAKDYRQKEALCAYI